MRLWRPIRRRRGLREHGLVDIEVRGLEHLTAAMSQDQGVLVTPNHPSHADPFVLLEAADQLASPFYFMTAWQVFAMTHRIGRRVLRQHGCFSINREGYDVRAFRFAVDVLANQRRPLVVFPEGEVLHLNDRVMPFRRGAATAALLAARRAERPVACIPCAIKIQYVDDPTPNLSELAARLEHALFAKPPGRETLARRVHRLAEAMVARGEIAHLGQSQRGPLRTRTDDLMNVVLRRLEVRYRLSEVPWTVPERVKRLRFHVIRRRETSRRSVIEQRQCRQDLDDLFQVMQVYSYPVDYLDGMPSLERLAETLDKLEEDVLGVRSAGLRGLRWATTTFGAPIIVEPQAAGKSAAEILTRRLELGVGRLLDQTHIPSPQPGKPDRVEPPPVVAKPACPVLPAMAS